MALLLTGAACAAATDSVWGRTQLGQESAPPEVMAKFVAFDVKSRASGKKQTDFFADEFMAANNLPLESVSLEAWSGVGKTTGLQAFFAYIPVFVGVVMLGLW